MYRRKNQSRYKNTQQEPGLSDSYDTYAQEQREFHLQQEQQEHQMDPSMSMGRETLTTKGTHNKSRHAASGAKSNRRKENHLSYYAYGKSAAIEFVCDETKKHRIATIAIQAASAKEDDRGYAWEEKTVIQVPRNELLQVVAIMLGKMDRAEFRHATQYTSKSYTVEYQGNKIFFMVSERGKPIRAVGLNPDDTYQVITLFLRQLKTNSPWLSVAEIIDLIDTTVVQMRSHAATNDTAQDSVDDSENNEIQDDSSDGDENEIVDMFAEDEELLNESPQYIELKY